MLELRHDVMRIVEDYGLVPDAAYPEPENSRQMTQEILTAMAEADDSGWDVEGTVSAVREVLDRHLAPPPETVDVDGRRMTPKEYATDYLGVDVSDYVELMSYTSTPFYAYGEVDVPDNWWDYDGYVNLPIAVIHPAMAPNCAIDQETRQADLTARPPAAAATSGCAATGRLRWERSPRGRRQFLFPSYSVLARS